MMLTWAKFAFEAGVKLRFCSGIKSHFTTELNSSSESRRKGEDLGA